jgi:GDP-L-fucose synthase
MDYFAGKRVLVTGGAGFLGGHVVRRLRARSCASLVAPRQKDCDLRNWNTVCALLDDVRPHIVFHLAGVVAGIGGTRLNPAGSFYDNLIMGAHLLEAARHRPIAKLVLLGTVCSYPRLVPVPATEDDFWNGYPEATNAPYGIAKKALLAQAQACRQQYGLNAIYLIAANLYGPGDHFDPATSHVIPALMGKFCQAVEHGYDEVLCWGDGSPTREFLYVEDCAEALVLAAERYDGEAPVNLGTGVETRISDLAQRLALLTGFAGRIVWDRSRPQGQPRRCWDVSRAEKYFGFRARTGLADGLDATLRWYRTHFLGRRTYEENYPGISERQ